MAKIDDWKINDNLEFSSDSIETVKFGAISKEEIEKMKLSKVVQDASVLTVEYITGERLCYTPKFDENGRIDLLETLKPENNLQNVLACSMKHAFKSQSEASQRAIDLNRINKGTKTQRATVRAYKCLVCNNFHLTKMDKRVYDFKTIKSL
jgi:hypothetical protein